MKLLYVTVLILVILMGLVITINPEMYLRWANWYSVRIHKADTIGIQQRRTAPKRLSGIALIGVATYMLWIICTKLH
jgi:hypothetical protein